MTKPEMPAPTFTVKVTTSGNATAARSGPTYGHVNSVNQHPPTRRLRSTWRPLTRQTPAKPPVDDGPSE